MREAEYLSEAKEQRALNCPERGLPQSGKRRFGFRRAIGQLWRMDLTPFQFLVAAFSTYRISLLFTAESGPAKIFAKLRRAPKKHSAVWDWLQCLWCFSMTASAVVCGALWLAGVRQHYAGWFLTWTALSAVAIALNQKLTRDL